VTGGGGDVSGSSSQEGSLDDDGPFSFMGHSAREQWEASGANLAGEAKTVKAIAICKRHGGLRLKQATRNDITTGHSVDFKVHCPGGTSVTGGGVVDFPSELPRVSRSHPFDGPDRRHVPDDGWRVAVYNSVAVPMDVKAYAICSRRLHPHYEFAGFGGVTGIAAGIAANCGAGTALLGGGARITGAPDGTVFLNEAMPFDESDRGTAPDDGFNLVAVVQAGPPRRIASIAICKR
jgi:hypothetical protein